METYLSSIPNMVGSAPKNLVKKPVGHDYALKIGSVCHNLTVEKCKSHLSFDTTDLATLPPVGLALKEPASCTFIVNFLQKRLVFLLNNLLTGCWNAFYCLTLPLAISATVPLMLPVETVRRLLRHEAVTQPSRVSETPSRLSGQTKTSQSSYVTQTNTYTARPSPIRAGITMDST